MIISICDDNREIADRVCLTCRECLDMDNEILIFYNGFELLECKKEMDLIILDIEMPGIDGIEVKNRLREQNVNALVIFLTNHKDYMRYAFDINVLGFVEKSDLDVYMPGMLERADEILNKNTIIENNINSDDVLYIKSEHNYCRLIISDGSTHLVRKSMKKYEEELSSYNFVRIHRECLVNMKWIDKINVNYRYVRVCGEKLSISARLKDAVKEKYGDFCRRNARYC